MVLLALRTSLAPFLNSLAAPSRHTQRLLLVSSMLLNPIKSTIQVTSQGCRRCHLQHICPLSYTSPACMASVWSSYWGTFVYFCPRYSVPCIQPAERHLPGTSFKKVHEMWISEILEIPLLYSHTLSVVCLGIASKLEIIFLYFLKGLLNCHLVAIEHLEVFWFLNLYT
jgi:hypothetical protein